MRKFLNKKKICFKLCNLTENEPVAATGVSEKRVAWPVEQKQHSVLDYSWPLPLNNARRWTPAAAAATRWVKGISGCVCVDVQFKDFASDVFPCTAPRCNEHTDGIFPSDTAFSCNLQSFIMFCTVPPTHTHYPTLASQLRPLLVCTPWCSGIASFSLTLPSGCKACSAHVKTEETSLHAGAGSPARCSFSSMTFLLPLFSF